MLDDVLDKEAGLKPKLVTQPAGVVAPTSGSPTPGSPISGSGIRHVPQADLDAYINGQLAGPRLDFCRTHLDSCEECRTELEDLRNFKNSRAGVSIGGSLRRELDRRKRQRQLKAAATAAVVAGVVATVATVGWSKFVKPRLHAASVVAAGAAATPARNVVQAPTSADAPSSAPPAAAAAQTAATAQPHAVPVAQPRATPTAQPRATAAASAQQPVAQPRVAGAQATGTAQPTSRMAGPAGGPSAASAAMVRPSGTSAASAAVTPAAGTPAANAAAPAAGTSFALLGPFGDEISDDRPEFTWQPLAGATKYAIILVDEGLRPIEHKRVKTTSWRPHKPLRRGRTYLWQVTAILRNGTKVIGTGPTAMEARIHIALPSGNHSDK